MAASLEASGNDRIEPRRFDSARLGNGRRGADGQNAARTASIDNCG